MGAPCGLDPMELHTVIIGAGMGGVASAVHMLKAGVAGAIRVFEAGAEVGGVWSANRYPGCACDVPAQLYTFSFAQKLWPRAFASQPELLAYAKDVVRTYRLEEDGILRLNHRVVEARWQEDTQRWQVMVSANGGEPVRYTSRFLIAAAGALSVPTPNKIPGLDRFKGVSMHTANWDQSVDLKGKRVAVVGTGASAIQVIPEMARIASEVVVFQRTPAWVIAKNNLDLAGLGWMLKVPGAAYMLRWLQYRVTEDMIQAFTHPDSTKAQAIRAKHIPITLKKMHDAVKDPEKRAALTPNYRIGCKRILLSDEFYESMGKDHVCLVPLGVTEVTDTGLVDARGHRHDVDAIVWATGFDLEGMYDNVPIYGRGGKHWGELLRGEGLGAYLGGLCVGLPNFVGLQAGYQGLGHSSVVLLMEAQARMVAALTHTLLSHGVVSFEVTPAAASAFRQEMQRRLSQTVWTTGGCTSWYTNVKGKATTLMWPGTVREFEDRCAQAAGHLETFTLRDERGNEVAQFGGKFRWGTNTNMGVLVWGAAGVAGALAVVAMGALGRGQRGRALMSK